MTIVRYKKPLEDAVSNSEIVPGSNPLVFGLGDEIELNTFLLKRQEMPENTYPLFWYVLPNRLKNTKYGYAEGRCRFFLATNSDLDWMNDQRYDQTFEKILYPNLENVLEQFSKSENITYENDEFFWEDRPNYTDVPKNVSPQVHIWDCLLLEIDLKIYNNSNCKK